MHTYATTLARQSTSHSAKVRRAASEAARIELRNKIESRSTDDLLATLMQLTTANETRESVIVAGTIADVIAAREGIEELMWEVEGGTYLDAVLIALATRDAATHVNN